MAVQAKPDGYHTMTPYLVVEGAGAQIEFLKAAFDAEELTRMEAPGGQVAHAELKIGDSRIMVGDAQGQHTPTQVMLYLYVDDVDATFHTALAAGAKEEQPPTDQFYGDRSGGVRDQWGNRWWIATHIEDVPPEELHRRAQARAQAGGN